MLIMPLHKPWSRHNIPWVTLLLVLVNVLVFAGYQRDDETRTVQAMRNYVDSGLAALEAPAYARYLAQPGMDPARRAEWSARPVAERPALLAQHSLYDVRFQQQLRAGGLLDDAQQRAQWQALRATYDAQLQRIFTLRHLQRSSEWSPARMLASTFLHANVDHLLGNMVFLLAIGTLLEGAVGSGWFLLLYLLGGFASSAASAYWRWGTVGGGLGASGAIAALMGAFCVVWGRRRVRLFYWLLVVFDYVRAPAIVLLPLWLGWELYNLWHGEPGVGFDAHAGGLVAGALLGALLVATRQTRPAFMDSDAQAADAQVDDRFERAQRHLGRMENGEAERLLAELASERPHDLQIALARYRAAHNAGRCSEARRHAEAVLRIPVATVEQTRRQLAIAAELESAGAGCSVATRLVLVARCLSVGLLGDAERLLRSCDSTSARDEQAQQWLALALRHAASNDAAVGDRLLQHVLEQFPEQAQAGKARFLLDNR
ncbi:rhomboid family intramembrane serine protease [Xanthomonas maliensis]|uniref:rhomboid family intramembrane serine protease n=1 Tax=Xanthomonas maliensis TaxID=1321368 RepID=UPI0004CF7591|nr:rhomboid family intramembrane serine protease [Xanthomonas maliensis]